MQPSIPGKISRTEAPLPISRVPKQDITPRHGATWRAILLGMLLIVPNAYWIMQVEAVWNTGHSTCLSLMWHVVVNLLALILLNTFLLKRFWPRVAFTQGELITVYVMLSLAGGVAGRDSYQILTPVMGWAFWFATPENEWASLFHRYLPDWLTVQNREVLRPFYLGESTLYSQEHLRAFLSPVLWWTALVTVLGWVMLCLNLIVRRQWTQHEKLSYPIIQLPLQITREGGELSFFRNGMLWAGFAVGAGIDLLNGLHFLYPFVPHLPVSYLDHNLGKYFTSSPWNAIGSLPIPMYPFAIALGFFLPLDLAFSTWFFYLFRKAQQILGAAAGFHALPGFPYLNQQSTGAWLGLCLVVLWTSRRHLIQVARKVILNAPDVDDSGEPMSYRRVAVGLALGLGFVALFCYRMGMSLWMIMAFFGIFFMLSLAITRVRAELGPPTHELVGMNPGNMMVDIIGTRRLGTNNLSIFPLFWWFAGRGYRGHFMPHQLETLKMAEQTRMATRRLSLAMVLAILVGSLAAFWALLHLSFREGLDLIPIGHDSGVFWQLQSRLSYLRGGDHVATGFMGIGMLFTFFLMAMRMRFLWWPLHPAGYALSTNFGIDYLWFCLLIASLLKWIILKYGGMGSHRRAIPFFIGVILGEYITGSFWSLLSVFLQQRTYDFYHA